MIQNRNNWIETHRRLSTTTVPAHRLFIPFPLSSSPNLTLALFIHLYTIVHLLLFYPVQPVGFRHPSSWIYGQRRIPCTKAPSMVIGKSIQTCAGSDPRSTEESTDEQTLLDQEERNGEHRKNFELENLIIKIPTDTCSNLMSFDVLCCSELLPWN